MEVIDRALSPPVSHQESRRAMGRYCLARLQPVFRVFLLPGIWSRTHHDSRHPGVGDLSTPCWPEPFLCPNCAGRQDLGLSDDAGGLPSQIHHDG